MGAGVGFAGLDYKHEGVEAGNENGERYRDWEGGVGIGERERGLGMGERVEVVELVGVGL